MHRNDIGVLQLRNMARLVPKTRARFFVLAQVGAHDFQGDGAAERLVARLIDHRHAAGPLAGEQTVALMQQGVFAHIRLS